MTANKYPINYPVPVGGGSGNDWGMQTNCMSCHSQAAYPEDNVDYLADVYTGLEDAYFKGLLRTDFAWSLPGNAISRDTSKRK